MEALGNDFISNTVSESSCGEERQEEMMDYAREDEAPEGMDLEDAAEIEDVVDVEEMPEDDIEAHWKRKRLNILWTSQGYSPFKRL